MDNEMLISKEFEFEAGHKLDGYCNGKKNTCGNIHGHSYKLIVNVAGSVDSETHMIIDFKMFSDIVKINAISILDHCYMNKDVPEIGYSTAENIIKWIWNRIATELDGYMKGKNYRLYELILYETRTSSVSYRGPGG